MKRICVIGAGPSGIFTLKAFHESDVQYEIVCYDSQKQIGGLWLWENENMITADYHSIHSPMYEHLRLNGPKETIEFADHLFPQSVETSFPERDVVMKFLEDYVEKFGLNQYINFNKRVENVCYLKNESAFKVTVSDDITSTSFVKEFDYVIVCTGHYCKPYQPIYPGEETFPGKIIHAKHFRSARRFIGLRVLVVGAGLSAIDIVVLCDRHGAKSATITSRKAITINLPSAIIIKPIFTRIDGSRVHFSDGSTDEFDVIVYCTGYVHSLDFLEEKLQFHSRDRLALPLYLGTVLPANTKLFYVGMASQVYTFTMFYHQAKLIRCILEGKVTLPSFQEMQSVIKEWQCKEELLKGKEACMGFQNNHMKELIDLTHSDERYLVLSHFLRLCRLRAKEFDKYTDLKFERVF